MAYSLINRILSQAKDNLQLRQFSELNELLRQQPQTFWIASGFKGGLGDAYVQVSSFFTLKSIPFNEESIITAIDLKKLLQYACLQSVGSNQKMRYIAGICFSLVAVYATDYALKKMAYIHLKELFGSTRLNSASIVQECDEFLTPISLNDSFFLTHRIINSWFKIKEIGQDVLAFETTRQEKIRQTWGIWPINQSMRLLGLYAEDFNKDKIHATSSWCRSKLKALSGLKDIKSHPLFNSLNEAADLLILVIDFQEFDIQAELAQLNSSMKIAIKTQLFREEALFKEVHTQFKRLDEKLKRFSSIKTEGPYITERMRQDLFSHNGLSTQAQLRDEAASYWQHLSASVYQLATRAGRCDYSLITTQKDWDSVNQLVSEIGHMSAIISEVAGSAVDDSYVLTEIAYDAKDKLKELSERSENLKHKLDTHDEFVKSTAQTLIRLIQTPVNPISDETDLNRLFQQRHTLIEIKEQRLCLPTLEQFKALADSEFRKIELNSVNLDSVVDVVTKQLLKVHSSALKTALKSYIGSSYNPARPLNDTLKAFFQKKKDQNLQEIAVLLIGDVKAMINEQGGDASSISGKDLFPKVTHMTYEIAIAELQSQEKKLKDSVQLLTLKLKSELEKIISPLIEKYKKAIQLTAAILEEKNSLDFLWKQPLHAFNRAKQELQKVYAEVSLKIPALAIDNEPSIQVLIVGLSTQKAAFEQEAFKVNQEIGKASLACLKYLRLKNLIKSEKKLYLAKGKHHQDRIDSLDRLVYQMETIDGHNSDTRFSLLLEQVKLEQAKTAASHLKIGFLGAHRSCQLQKMYSKIIAMAGDTDKLEGLSFDCLQYTLLKNYLDKKKESYMTKGSHHRERHASLARLGQKIIDLDGHTSDDRFEQLLAAIRQEEQFTKASHKKVGFFGDWRPCQLEKMYKDVIHRAISIKNKSQAESDVVGVTMQKAG